MSAVLLNKHDQKVFSKPVNKLLPDAEYNVYHEEALGECVHGEDAVLTNEERLEAAVTVLAQAMALQTQRDGQQQPPSVNNGSTRSIDTLRRDIGILAILLGMIDRKSTRLNSSHIQKSRMPSSA